MASDYKTIKKNLIVAGVTPRLNIFYSIEMGLQGKSWNEITANFHYWLTPVIDHVLFELKQLFLHFFVYPLQCFYFLITCLAWLPRLILRLLTFQQEGVDLSLELVLDLVYVSVEFWVQHFESRQVLTFGDHLVDLVGNHCLAGLSELAEIVNLSSWEQGAFLLSTNYLLMLLLLLLVVRFLVADDHPLLLGARWFFCNFVGRNFNFHGIQTF